MSFENVPKINPSIPILKKMLCYFGIIKPTNQMSEELVQYDVFQEVGDFLDEIPPSLRKKAVVEYKKFLHLKNLTRDTKIPAKLSPSELIDQVWHIHLMRPCMYEKFCKSIFGETIDHDLAGSKSGKNEKFKRLERTKILYRKVFNDNPDGNIWNENGVRKIPSKLNPNQTKNTRKVTTHSV